MVWPFAGVVVAGHERFTTPAAAEVAVADAGAATFEVTMLWLGFVVEAVKLALVLPAEKQMIAVHTSTTKAAATMRSLRIRRPSPSGRPARASARARPRSAARRCWLPSRGPSRGPERAPAWPSVPCGGRPS